GRCAKRGAVARAHQPARIEAPAPGERTGRLRADRPDAVATQRRTHGVLAPFALVSAEHRVRRPAIVRVDRGTAARDALAVDALLEALDTEMHAAAPGVDVVVPGDRARVGARREAERGKIVVD